jgi:hypothetical protein
LIPVGLKKRDILGNEGDGIGAGPEGVIDASALGVVIIASFTLSKTIITAKEHPVTEGCSVTIGIGKFEAGHDCRHHGVMDQCTSIWDMFVFADCIHHE